MKPFKMKFSYMGLMGDGPSKSFLLPHEVPNYADGTYEIPCQYPGGCLVNIVSNTLSIKGKSSHWKWGDSGYECDYTAHRGDVHNPQDCPLIAE